MAYHRDTSGGSTLSDPVSSVTSSPSTASVPKLGQFGGADGVEFGHVGMGAAPFPMDTRDATLEQASEASWTCHAILEARRQPSRRVRRIDLPRRRCHRPNSIVSGCGRGRKWPLSVVLWRNTFSGSSSRVRPSEQSSGCTPASTRHMTWPGLIGPRLDG